MVAKKSEVTTTQGPKVVEEINEVAEVKQAEEITEVKVSATPITVDEKDRMVSVKSKIAGSRFIAGHWYDFEKDKDIMVTEYAKGILRKADAIYI
jgi:hypothetical protein